MYEELLRTLRDCPDAEYGCSMCKYQNSLGCREKLMSKAAETIEELSKPKWIPVTERLPEKAGTYIICDCYGRVCSRHFCKSANAFSGYWHSNGSKFYGNPTHWMPLPDPPKEESE